MVTSPKIFISYRRDDVASEAGRLCDALRDALGGDEVFQDIAMEPGVDFPQEITDALNDCAVVLALMGPNWLTASDEYGRRKVDDPEDWVRREIAIALNDDNCLVIPVFLDGLEKMPPAKVLPDEIDGLANRNFITVSNDHWHRDKRQLIETVAQRCGIDLDADLPPTDSRLPPEYLDWVKRTYGTVELLGLTAVEASHGRLRQVYVPAVTTRPPSLEDDGLQSTEPAQRSLRTKISDDEQDRPTLLLDILSTTSAYVPGEPGAGKSTFCRWLAWVLANDAVPAHGIAPPEGYAETLPTELTGKLPLLVELREFAAHMDCKLGEKKWHHQQLETALVAWLDEVKPGGLTGAVFLQQLGAGKVVLALDGVDEVATVLRHDGSTTHPRACLLSALADALNAWQQAGNRIVVTSRPYGLSGAETRKLDLPMQSLAPLPEPLQRLFIERWYAATDVGRREANTRGLTEHLANRRDLDVLTQSPLLLTALCILFGQGQRLPDDLFELYDGLVSSVLYARYSEDSAQRSLVRNRLAAIAYGMHTGVAARERNAPQPQVHNDEADEHLREFAAVNYSLEGTLHEPAERRKSLLEKSGLLQAADSDHVQFYHLSFQEFLSADHVLRTRKTDDDLLAIMRQRGDEKAWRPTLMYLFTGLVKRDAQWGFTLLNALVQRLTREYVSQNPSLAAYVAQCAEVLVNKQVSLGSLSTQLTQICLDAIEDEVEVKDRQILGLTLGVLGDPRMTKARDPAGFIEIPAGEYRDSEGEVTIIDQPFWLGRYLVTNQQYREFINAGGYDIAEFWSEEGIAWLGRKTVSEPRLWRDTDFNYPNQPVVGISFFEAQAYCHWAGGRLPSKEESRAAATGPKGLVYPWGDNWEDGICNTGESGLEATSPVGLFPRSRHTVFGLEDMAGNVFEWCDSKPDENTSHRVMRGGSWDIASRRACSAYSTAFISWGRFNNVGFRVLCSSP
ncbi:MAG: SUMF1/EgtB/PvdO family nonheme iron enzyme, partial [Gammaproteobacteria bacterium]